MARVKCVILGAGGHARMLVDCLTAHSSVVEIVGILDPKPTLWGQSFLGFPILGGDELLSEMSMRGVTSFVVGVGGIGDNRPRRWLFDMGLANGLEPYSVRHSSSILSASAKVGLGVQMLPGSIINAGTQLGANVIVNSGAIVEHDCVLGDHVHIATGARIAGEVQIATGAHVGAGATVRQGIIIGEWSVVGIGSAVVKNVEPFEVVAGVPARLLRKSQQLDQRGLLSGSSE